MRNFIEADSTAPLGRRPANGSWSKTFHSQIRQHEVTPNGEDRLRFI
jgi:hypothetical protein